MFTRERPIEGTDKIRVVICESVRTGSKVTQKTIRHVGVARNASELKAYLHAAEVLKHEILTSRRGGALFDDFDALNEGKAEVCKKKRTQVRVENLKELERRIEGPLDVFGHAAELMKINQLVKSESCELLHHLISQRISAPASKRRTRNILEKDAGFNCSLDSIYRLLTRLGSKHEEVNKIVSSAAKDLFDSKIDLMFFDVTTLYCKRCI